MGSGYKSIIAWLWQALKGNRTQAILNATLGLLQVAVSLLSVWAVQRAIDIATGGAEPSTILWAVAIMGTFIAASFAINISLVWIRNILGVKAQNRMQRAMVSHLLNADWRGMEKHHSGDVINRLEMDVKTVVEFLTETLPTTLSTLAMFLGAFAYLFAMDSTLALIVVAIIPVFIIFSRIYVRRMRVLTKDIRTSDSEVQSLMQETVQQRTLIKAVDGNEQMGERIDGLHAELRTKVKRRTKFRLASNLMLNIGFALGYLTAFAWAALRLAVGTISFGGMTAFLQLVGHIQSPARSLTKLAPAFVNVLTAAERLMELEQIPLEEQGEAIMIGAPCGIRFANVNYSYEAQQVIKSLSYVFHAGECTAITGATGAGKTTIMRLILALIKPQEGTITLFNDSEEHEACTRTRANFVYVPQGNTLMSGTIRDNLLLTAPEATDEQMREALRLSCADFVLEQEEGLDMLCGENGAGLSEGQCQRICIARALLRQRPIMLFDEATSALDPDTERQLLENILATGQRTILFITHRPATLAYCSNQLSL